MQFGPRVLDIGDENHAEYLGPAVEPGLRRSGDQQYRRLGRSDLRIGVDLATLRI